MDSNWDTDDFHNAGAHLAKVVSAVRICAYRNDQNEGDEDGNPATNHWAMFLQTGSSSSVRLDMAPGYGSDGRRGKIQILAKSYTHTTNSIKTLSISVVGDRKVRDIISLINTKGRQRYTFTSAFEGCRYWIYTIVSDLEEAGFVAPGSKGVAWEALCKYWRNPDGSENREVGEGTFYSQ